MTLRGRLVAVFSAIILTALLLFGLFAYHIALTSSTEKEVELLKSMAREKVAALVALGIRDDAPSHWREAIASYADNDYLTLIVDLDERREIAHAGRPAMTDLAARHEELRLDNLLRAGADSGSLEHGDHAYLWSIMAIPGTRLGLVLIYESRLGSGQGLSPLTGRLLVTAILLLWATTWVILILATRISQRLESQTARLRHQARFDDLTGLPNRNLMKQRLQEAIRHARDEGRSSALLMVDLDRFKEINDTLGHHIGDELLRLLGRRLSEALQDGDTVARPGGDEFGIVLPLADHGQALRVAEKVIQTVAMPLQVESQTLSIECSLGIARYPEHGEDSDILIRHAEVAMYQAKKTGGGHAFYDPKTDPHSRNRLALIGDLRHALEQGDGHGLELHYQPKVDLGENRTASAEALLRWTHPERGAIPPNLFIPLVEQTSLIKPLTLWVLETAVRECRRWQRDGHDIGVAVNLSTRNLHDEDMPRRIEEILQRFELPAGHLTLEITETAIVLDPCRANEVFQQLDRMGVHLSIDDFGTGYTSLSHLKQLPMDEIKIDRSFVMDMLNNEDDETIVHTIIELAHNMGLKVIAEGVEDEATQTRLRELGCDTAQGYHISRPLPGKDFSTWLGERA